MTIRSISAFALAAMLLFSCSNSDEVDDPTSGTETPEEPELTLDLPQSEAISSIPLPPQGQRWVLNHTYTDEFEGTELDGDKWYDYHTQWVGRAPGLFKPSQVSVSDGCLVLTAAKMTDTVVNGSTFNVACAAVISKTQDAHFGYYEACFKANQTPLSTTFWLSTKHDQGMQPVEGTQPDGIPDGTYSEEIDICEVVGRYDPTQSWQEKMVTGMNSNAHFKLRPATGESQYNIDIEGEYIPYATGKKSYDDFNIYGCWWVDKSQATYYLNNGKGYNAQFVNKDDPTQTFWLPASMGINMVMETYDWAPSPTYDELADETKNKSYYEWVRAYVLMDIDAAESGSDNYVFENHIHFSDEGDELVAATTNGVEVLLAYTATLDSQINLTIYDLEESKVATVSYDALSGYGNSTYSINGTLESGVTYYVLAELSPKSGGECYEADSFSFEL